MAKFYFQISQRLNSSSSEKTGILLFFCVLTILLVSQTVKSQPAQYFENHEYISNPNVGTISSAVFDKKGFVWVGGSNGLARHDGLQAKNYLHDSKDSLSIIGNDISHLFYDSLSNQLLISAWGNVNCGLSIFDIKSESCKNLEFDPSLHKGLAGKSFRWALKDRFGQYWISVFGSGIVRYFPEEDSIEHFKFKYPNIEAININDLISYSFDSFNDSLLWIGTRAGVLKFNMISTRYEFFPFPKTVISFKSSTIRTILHHANNKLYVGTWTNGLYEFDPTLKRFIKINFANLNKAYPELLDCNLKIIQKSNSSILVTTKAGLIDYDTDQKEVILFKENNNEKGIFWGAYQKDKKSRFFFWRGGSLRMFHPLKQQNQVYQYPSRVTPKGFLVRDILEDKNTGKLWIPSQFAEGLYRFDLANNKWELFKLSNSYFKKSKAFNAWDVLQTQSEEILVLSSSHGILKVLEKEKQLIPWIPPLDLKLSRQMIEDRNGNIWVGTKEDGVLKIDPKTKKIKQYKDELFAYHGEGIGQVRYLQEDKNGNIWMRSKGFSVYDVKKDTFYNFPYFFPEEQIVYHIQTLTLDANGNTWIVSHQGSIGITDADHPERGIVEYFNQENGLAMEKAWFFLLDKDENMWINGSGIFQKVDSERNQLFNYKAGCFSTIEVSTINQLSNGYIALGDRNRISIFNPDSLVIDQSIPQPYVSGFKIFDEDVQLKNSFSNPPEIRLQANQNFFTLEISALDTSFLNRNEIEFLYKLEGVDPDWVNPKKRRSISYTNVDGGTYELKLKAKRKQEEWKDDYYLMTIHVATPWYKTSIAFIIYMFLIGGLTYLFYQLQLWRKLEQQETMRLKELDTFKTRFYANITHEFRTPLTVIQGMADELELKPEQEPKKKIALIKKNSKNLLSLVNQMLDLSKLQAGKIESELIQDDIIVFLKYLIESTESYARSQNIGLQFYSEEDQLIMDYDAKNIQRIISNLLSNAIKFTPDFGNILVIAKKENIGVESTLKLIVKDSGIGISEEQLPYIFERFHQAHPIYKNQGSGIGLALVKELTETMGGEIKVKSAVDQGSSFTLSFPIKNNAPASKKSFPSVKTQENTQNPDTFLTNIDPNLPILLIIEDNTDVAYYIQSCLENEYQILISPNGKLGVEKAIELVPDIIISDVMMPVMDGFEVCSTLKADERTNHIPIILLTARATSEDKLTGLKYGADAYLIKPFEKEELVTRIEKLLEIREVLQQKYSTSASILLKPQVGEDTFIAKVEKIVFHHLDNENFSVNELAKELLLSRSQVHRKIKALTGMSTTIFIRHLRLIKAKELLSNRKLSIAEIAYKVGFKSPVYFSQVFKEKFGTSPNATRK